MSDESLLTFPCSFPVKIMGKNHHGFHKEVIEIFKNHLTDFDETEFSETESKNNKYCSITVKVNAVSQAHLDGIYYDLTASEWVIMAL